MSTASLHLPGAAATEAAGARLASTLTPGMIVNLSGELGTGKTTLVRGCLRALGWHGRVKSPTYTLVEHYPISSIYFYHFDFYRFADPSEWETAGLADAFRDDSVCLVEWPERVGARLPPPDLMLEFSYAAEGGRELTLHARSQAGERCLSAIVAVRAPR
jgi:tRNA threonylcarbamoyladenosine biosynthesis protein TsaE